MIAPVQYPLGQKFKLFMTAMKLGGLADRLGGIKSLSDGGSQNLRRNCGRGLTRWRARDRHVGPGGSDGRHPPRNLLAIDMFSLLVPEPSAEPGK
jgi:hypothetical protein